MIGWVLLLFFLGMVLILAEVIVPGGICGTIGGLSVLASIILGCYAYPDYTLFIVIGEALASVACIVLGLYFLPRTSLGKKFILSKNLDKDQGWVVKANDESLVGALGEVYTALRPAGTIVVDGKRLDAVSDGEFIDKGEKIRVIQVHGNRIVVERVPDE